MQNDEMVSFNLTGLPALVFILALGFVAFGIPSMRVARRTGKSIWVALLMSVPFVNVVVLWVFAFSSWPKLQEEPRT